MRFLTAAQLAEPAGRETATLIYTASYTGMRWGGLTAAWDPSEEPPNASRGDKNPGHEGGASWNRTSDLILIRSPEEDP
ncbi:MAG TPA: hypothetical protein VGR26_12735 [Acidimicrobiales bacterium]|nr:hypothetical protein [Acidimicrobiales bacterium]